MPTSHIDRSISRRTALAGLGAGSLGLAVAARGQTAVAQDATTDALAEHPFAGTWLVTTPGGISPATFAADGSVVLGFPPSYVDPQLGPTFHGPALGTWEAAGERRGHFAVVQALSDANGAIVGTFLFEGHPTVSDDGQTFTDAEPQRVIIRDAANAVIFDQVLPVDPPVTASRIGTDIGAIPFPAGTPGAGTPAT